MKLRIITLVVQTAAATLMAVNYSNERTTGWLIATVCMSCALLLNLYTVLYRQR